jgi:hypothetical protein
MNSPLQHLDYKVSHHLLDHYFSPLSRGWILSVAVNIILLRIVVLTILCLLLFPIIQYCNKIMESTNTSRNS